MSKEEINKSSLAFIYAISGTIGKRLCEKLGVPYNNDDEELLESDRQKIIDADDKTYPLLKSANKEHYSRSHGVTKAKGKPIGKPSSKEDIIRIWGDIANIEDNT